jgi:ACS family hexuronate transporter-like MFS transporter
VLVYNCCALLAAASVAVPWLPAGWPLLGVLLVMGFGGLGLFPCYYAFGQELSTEHQGKVSGTLGSAAWASAALLHWLFGKFVDYWGSYDLGMMAAGLCPLLGSAALMWLWREPDGHA